MLNEERRHEAYSSFYISHRTFKNGEPE